MKESSKETIIKSLRSSLMDKAECEPEPSETEQYFDLPDDDLPIVFAQQFTKAGGTLYYCANEEEVGLRLSHVCSQYSSTAMICSSDSLTGFVKNLVQGDVRTVRPGEAPKVGIVACEALLAWNGTVAVTAMQGLGTTLEAMPPVTVLVAFTSQVTTDWQAALANMEQMYGACPDEVAVL
ncbi:MAG: hypothetical protein J6X62_06925 [Bacteroidales bacterium]|nr:hypothetical protein [Bacteroidales bacterium]